MDKGKEGKRRKGSERGKETNVMRPRSRKKIQKCEVRRRMKG